MTLRTPAQVPADGHGIRPFSYTIEFSSSPDPRQFASDDWAAQERIAEVNLITLGYGVEEYVARFRMWSEETTTSTTQGQVGGAMMAPPKNGDLIRIWVRTANDSQFLQFKGCIRSVHERRVENGISYNCEAVSDVSRLNDVHVTLLANLQENPLSAAPRFDQSGSLVHDVKKTVAELIDSILDCQDAWGTTKFFTKDDIDWNELRTDVRCGGYIPNEIHFNNTPKGQAIMQVLQMAGNYTISYCPDTDKLRIIELNLRCNKVGDLWDIRFPNRREDEISSGDKYAEEVDVKSDETIWTSQQTANVCRLTGNRIRWYSGHWILPRRTGIVRRNADGLPILADGKLQIAPDSDTRHTVPDRTDTADLQIKRAKAFEGFSYRFEVPNEVGPDRRQVQRYWVGMALFPDWDVHRDFHPAFYQILDVKVPDAKWFKDGRPTSACPQIMLSDGWHTPTDRGDAIQCWRGRVEFETFTAGDQISQKAGRLDQVNHLRTYQAWYAKDPCPACNGTGAVAKVYNNAANEPEFKVEVIGDEFTIKVANYLFDPWKFGTVDPATRTQENPQGTLYPPTGLTAYTDTTTYPVPYKNLCPYCRGVGLKPEWKIRNVETELAIGRHPQANPSTQKTEDTEINLDPDIAQTSPETWQDSQNRVALRLDANLSQETSLYNYLLPAFTDKDKPFAMFTTAYDNEGRPVQSAYRFAHPLAYGTVQPLFNSLLNPTPTGEHAVLIPSGLPWMPAVPFTTVRCGSDSTYTLSCELGQVLFHEPIFVPCYKVCQEFVIEKDKVTLNDDGTPKRTQTGGGALQQRDADGRPTGFWRQARVWLQGFYTRPGLYDRLTTQETRSVTAQTAEGDTETYLVRSMIVDGRYCLEVKKQSVDNEGGNVEFSADNRVIQTTLEEDGVVEVYPDDFAKDPSPPSATFTDAEYEAYKTDVSRGNYAFPRGKLMQWQPPSVGEQRLAAQGEIDMAWYDSTHRPKMYSWRLRDERCKMLGRAIRTLELQNNIQVTGTLAAMNLQVDPSRGLGYVDYPGRGHATVRRVTYNFGNDLTAELELTIEQARFGEPLKDDQAQLHAIEKQVARLTNIVNVMNNRRNDTKPGSVYQRPRRTSAKTSTFQA